MKNLNIIWIPAVAMILQAPSVFAGIDEMLESIRESDILFPRTDSYVPFIPTGWVTYHYYADTTFASVQNPKLKGSFQEHEASAGAILPAYAGGRNLVLAGLDANYIAFDSKSASPPDSQLWMVTPLAAYLRQIGDRSQIAGFVAPICMSPLGGGEPWNPTVFAGVLGGYYPNDRWSWFYGGVYEYSFGQSYGYPYVGFNWIPDRHWDICLVVPWPSVIYAPTERLFFQLGAEPGDADFNVGRNGRDANAVFESYNLMASVGYRLNKYLWLNAATGMAGLRSFEISGNGVEFRTDIKAGPVFMISLQFRPSMKREASD